MYRLILLLRTIGDKRIKLKSLRAGGTTLGGTAYYFSLVIALVQISVLDTSHFGTDPEADPRIRTSVSD
jgi:hypothetical protein